MDYWVLKIVSMFQTALSANRMAWIAMVIFIMASCSTRKESLPYYNEPDFTPYFLENADLVEKQIVHQIGSFKCTNQDGKYITEKDIEGKVHVANFMFTTCAGICPKMTHNLKPVAQRFQNNQDFMILSFSVMPWVDSVQKLKAYQELQQITATNWQFLTGNSHDIYTLARTSYFAEEETGFTKDSTDFLHTEHILLVDRSKRIRGIYNGTLQTDIQQLITYIDLLLKE